MKNQTSLRLIAVFTALTTFNFPTQANDVYNLTGWDSTGTGGLDGGLPPTWTGTDTPNYTGSLNAMWYADVAGKGSSDVLSTAGAVSQGADPTFALAVGPMGWSMNSSGMMGMGHGADFGLIQLETASNLTITLAADSSLSSLLQPGFSLFQGWDTGSTANRYISYSNNQNNPLSTQGLTYLDGAGNTKAGGSVTLSFTNLSAGDYTIFIGGDNTASAGVPGQYTVALSAAAVPVPAAVWLFGSALLGLIPFGRSSAKRS